MGTEVEETVSSNIDVYEYEAVDEKEGVSEDSSLEPNPAMEKAMKGGWAPKEDWKGNPDDWVDYKEFNYRGELMSHIQRSNDKVSKLESQLDLSNKTLEKFAKLHQKTLEKEKQELLEAVEEERATAIEEGRGRDAIEAEKKAKIINEEFEKMDQDEEEVSSETEESSDPFENWPEEAVTWAKGHSDWYGKDAIKTRKADLIAEQYLVEQYEATGQQPPITEVLAYVDQKLGFKESEDKPTRRQAHQEIEPGSSAPAESNKSNGKSKYTTRDLSPEESKVISNMAEMSGLSVQEYIDLLAADGELEIQQK